jgi:hypothetical protein
MELSRRKRWLGWLVGLGTQALWLCLTFDRRLWRLLPPSAILIWRTAALRHWRRNRRALASRDDGVRGDVTPRQDDRAPRQRIPGGAA